MSSTQPGDEDTTQASGVAGVPMRFEVTALPVADVDRAKASTPRPRRKTRQPPRRRLTNVPGTDI